MNLCEDRFKKKLVFTILSKSGKTVKFHTLPPNGHQAVDPVAIHSIITSKRPLDFTDTCFGFISEI